MYTNIVAVALRTVKHNDRSSILTAWSPTHGRLSLVIPAGAGRESMKRRAATMPLGLFEGVVNMVGNQSLMRVHDVRPWGPEGCQPDVSSHPVRSAVAMFVAEVLGVVTLEGEGDPMLWQLVLDTVDLIARGNGVALANVPVMFLLRLAAVLGIEPDFDEWQAAYGLDTLEGVFRPTPPMHGRWVPAAEARAAAIMERASRQYAHAGSVRMPRSARNALFDGIVDYYVMHHFPLDRLRSPAVLRDLFRLPGEQ